jgi:hypothetical protein
VRGKQDCRAAFHPITLQVGTDPIRRIGIERGGGLIEKQHLRFIEERLGESHPGLLARREAADPALLQFFER